MAKCPYDNAECEKLSKRFAQWRRAVNCMAANQTKLVFVTSVTMLNKCDDIANCSRYTLWAQKQVQQKHK